MQTKMIYLAGHTTKHMTHIRSWDMEIGPPSVEDVTRGRSPRVTRSTSGRHISHVPLTHVRHLLTVESLGVCEEQSSLVSTYGTQNVRQ